MKKAMVQGHKGSKRAELGFKSQSSWTTPSTLPTLRPRHQQIPTALLLNRPTLTTSSTYIEH